MKFNVIIDKKAEAVIERSLCINCGKCREICPTGAAGEYRKAAFCMNCPEDGRAGESFADAKRQAVEKACSAGCPLGIIPQTIASLIAKGELELAAKHIRERNPVPGICAAVCDQSCSEVCHKSAFGDEPLNMRALERFVLSKTVAEPIRYRRKYHEKIAVIGAGPAGLAAAYSLAKSGYPVTIFEKDTEPGGAAFWGIPQFRLDKTLVREEIDRIIEAGIEIRYGWHIGAEHELDEIWDEGYSAVLIAVGDSYGKIPKIKGADAAGVYDAVTVMRQLVGGYDEDVNIGDKVVIVGYGSFAADLARVIVRLGKDVTCVSSEAQADMLMAENMPEILAEEGISLKTSTDVGQIITEQGKVKAVELVKGSASNYFCDTVIFAAGQKSVVGDICNAETYPDGKIRIDDEYKTNKEMIFACGDVTGETGSVAEAIAAGKAAASEIHRVLHAAVGMRKAHVLHNAPDGEAIYDENIRRGVPQHEEILKTAGELRAAVQNQEKAWHAEDIAAVLRAAGIEEEMPAFEFAPDAAKVAVVGGGIAGVTAAIFLARKGYRPTIFERESELGGSYRWLATDKRIDKALLRRELKKVEASGIDVIYNVSAGVRPDIEQMFTLGYDAVLFAIGTCGGGRHDVDGCGCAGVFDMAALMGRLADNEVVEGVGEKVLIAGGDEMTFDIAMKLSETCGEVTVLAPWSRGYMQKKTGAVDAAVSAGVNIVTGVEVEAVEHKNGRAYDVVCKVTDKGYTIKVPCDTVVLGGGGPDTDTIAMRNLKLDIDEDGYLAGNRNLAASIEGVFAIGDFDMSSADAGRTGAMAVDNYLSGKDTYISLGDKRKTVRPTDHEMIEGYKSAAKRGLECGVKGLDDEQALIEASRCMSCGYHSMRTDRCIGCGVCADACPVNAIELVAFDGGTSMQAAAATAAGKEA